MEKCYYVYILASQMMETLYTSNLIKRVYEHKQKLVEGFTEKYNVTRLVYYETYSDATVAIEREKQLKKWGRNWKLRLIIQKNPEWEDLYETIAA
jgi:putative endonuclease